jgi:hypothetical protein
MWFLLAIGKVPKKYSENQNRIAPIEIHECYYKCKQGKTVIAGQ